MDGGWLGALLKEKQNKFSRGTSVVISDVQCYVYKIAPHPTVFIVKVRESLLLKVTYSKIYCIVLRVPNFKWILGFPILSIILVKAGLTKIIHHACNASYINYTQSACKESRVR